MAVQMLYPFAPHFSEEIWDLLGEKEELITKDIPQIEKKYLEEEVVTYIVQINGKVRGKFDQAKDISEKELLDIVTKEKNIKRYLTKKIQKTIFVKNKILNIVL